MKRSVLAVSCVAAATLVAGQVDAQFYYGSFGRIPLLIDSTTITIKFDEGIDATARAALMSTVDQVGEEVYDEHLLEGFVGYALTGTADYESTLRTLRSLDGVYLVEPYYLTEFGDPLPVRGSFCVGFKSHVKRQEIDSINAFFKVRADGELEFMPKIYRLWNTDSTGYGVLDLANAYYKLDETRFSHPLFGVWPSLTYWRRQPMRISR